jgi:hypothetical protein
VKRKEEITKMILDDSMWDHMKLVVRALFPAIMILRLADLNKPAMDRLYFYVRRLNKCLQKSQSILDSFQNGLGKSSSSFMYYEVANKKSNIREPDDDEDSVRSDSDSSDGTMVDDEDISSDDDDSIALGNYLDECWKKRNAKLVHEYSISAWMLSPIPEVYADAKENQRGEDRMAMERLFRKLFSHEETSHKEMTMDEIMDRFWTEYEDFLSKAGVFAGRDYIWNASVLQAGESYMWHKIYSLPYTKYFGKFACRVTSKILGIGSAERNWGDVKHLKTDKRSHLSAERTKKQATIFGSDCAERAQIERAAVARHEMDTSTLDFFFWDDEDFDNELDFNSDTYEKEQTTKPNRLVNCWMEDWEIQLVAKKDAVAERKLLQKYGGLEFYDIDNNVMCSICNKDMIWRRKRRGGNGGWELKTYSEKWDEKDPDRADNEESWLLFDGCPIHELLAEYYDEKKNLDIVACVRKAGGDDP